MSAELDLFSEPGAQAPDVTASGRPRTAAPFFVEVVARRKLGTSSDWTWCSVEKIGDATLVEGAGDRCPTYRCGALLRFEIRDHGRVVGVCDLCTLRHAGICPDCRGPLRQVHTKMRLRCPKCAKRRESSLNARREVPHRRVLANRLRMRNYYRANAEAEKQRKREEHRFIRGVIGYRDGTCTKCGCRVPNKRKGPIPKWCDAHRPYRRSPIEGWRRVGEPNPDVPCACGCGEQMARYNPHGRARRYLPGHNRRRGVASRSTDSTSPQRLAS